MPENIQKRSIQERLRSIIAAGAGGMATGAATNPDPGTGAIVGGMSEAIQAFIIELSTKGVSESDLDTLVTFGEYVAQHAHGVDDSDQIMRDFYSDTGHAPDNLNLYADALKKISGRMDGAAKESMLSGLARTAFDVSPDMETAGLRHSINAAQSMTDEQISLIALLTDKNNPLSDLSMTIDPHSRDFNDYGVHKDFVVLELHEFLDLVKQQYIWQSGPMMENETPETYYMRMKDPIFQPRIIEDLKLNDLALTERGLAFARQLGLNGLSNEFKLALRDELDPNGVMLEELEQQVISEYDASYEL